MAHEQPDLSGRASRNRPPADSAPTQISGSDDAGMASRTVTSDEAAAPLPGPPAAWSAPARSPFGPAPQSPPPVPEGEETVVMDVSPGAPIPLAWLVVVDGPGAKRGKLVSLKPETVVGRTQGDLTLNGDRSVSSQHARIRMESRDGRQSFVLYDLASTNGTYAGTREGCRDEASRTYRRVLQDGDYVLVGETLLAFKQVIE